MTQERMDKNTDTTKVAPVYQAPNIDASLSRATSAMKKVRVVHGANEQYFDNLEGKTVGMVRKSLRDVFNIPGDAEALIGGKTVGDDFILEGAMNLEFVKEAGVKGATLNARVQKVLNMEQPTIRVIHEDGELVCTANHRIAVLTLHHDDYKWVQAKDLVTNDRLL